MVIDSSISLIISSTILVKAASSMGMMEAAELIDRHLCTTVHGSVDNIRGYSPGQMKKHLTIVFQQGIVHLVKCANLGSVHDPKEYIASEESVINY